MEGIRFDPSEHRLYRSEEAKQPPPKVNIKVPSDPLYAKGVIVKLTAKGKQGSSDTQGVLGFVEGDSSQRSHFLNSIKNAKY